jgi:Coenzyme PQQ synthesis protein D (PqqD)
MATSAESVLAVGPESTPAPGVAVHMVEVDGEAVLLDEATTRLHSLNSTATLVWQCLDGHSTLTEIAADLAEAFGADLEAVRADVVAIVEHFAEEGLLEGTGADDSVAGTDLAPASPSLTAPCNPCVDRHFAPETTHATVYDVDGTRMRVRANDAAVGQALRALVPSYVVDPEMTDVSTVVSLRVMPREAGTRDHHLVYRDGVTCSRAATIGRLVRAGLAHLDDLVPPPDGALRLRARLLWRPDGAVLVDARLGLDIDGFARRLERLGVYLSDAPGTLIAQATGHVVVPGIRLVVDDAAESRFTADEVPEPGELFGPVASVPVRGIVVWNLPDADAPAAERLAALAPLAPDDVEGSAAAIDLLAELRRHVTIVGAVGADPAELARRVEALFA